MLEDGRISNKQAILLMIMTIAPTAILFLPTMIYKEAKQDSWLSVVLVSVFGIIVAYIITTLGLMFKDKTIIQYSEIIAGKPLGKLIGLIYCIFFIYINTFVVREAAELLVGPFFPETPLLFFSIGIILVSIYIVCSGLEVLARANEVIFLLFVIAAGAILVLVFKDMEFKNLAPVLAEGLVPVAKGTYRQIVFFSETIVMAMFIPYLNIPQKARKSATIAVVFVGLLEICSLVGVVTVFGTQTARLKYPFLSLARYISITEYIERVDPLIMLMWVGGGIVKIAVFHYCAVLAIAQWLNLKDYRPLVVPVGIILVVFSIILWGNTIELTEQIAKMVPVPFTIIQAGIPAVLLITAKLRRKGEIR